jgi:hypothetical protein
MVDFPISAHLGLGAQNAAIRLAAHLLDRLRQTLAVVLHDAIFRFATFVVLFLQLAQ